MPLIEVLPNVQLNPDLISCTIFDPKVPKLSVWHGDVEPRVFTAADADRVWAVLRRHVTPAPEPSSHNRHYLACPKCRGEDLDNPDGTDEHTCKGCGETWEMYELTQGSPMHPLAPRVSLLETEVAGLRARIEDLSAGVRSLDGRTLGSIVWGPGSTAPALPDLFAATGKGDEAASSDPDGSKDKADIVLPPGWTRDKATGPISALACPACGGRDLDPDKDADMVWCRPCGSIWRRDELVAGSGGIHVGEAS